jgi:hypothetical protein
LAATFQVTGEEEWISPTVGSADEVVDPEAVHAK